MRTHADVSATEDAETVSRSTNATALVRDRDLATETQLFQLKY